jgi:hypothetical protein
VHAGLAPGLLTVDARGFASASVLPYIDARRDLGVFVTREAPQADPGDVARDESMDEVRDVLEQWGYAAPGAK